MTIEIHVMDLGAMIICVLMLFAVWFEEEVGDESLLLFYGVRTVSEVLNLGKKAPISSALFPISGADQKERKRLS